MAAGRPEVKSRLEAQAEKRNPTQMANPNKFWWYNRYFGFGLPDFGRRVRTDARDTATGLLSNIIFGG
jgi:hypothetical protein